MRTSRFHQGRAVLLGLVVGLGVLLAGPPTATDSAHAQSPDCRLTITAPVPQYVLPSVNGGSYGTTAPEITTLIALGTDPSRLWYAIVFDPNSTPPTYAWVLAADVARVGEDCAGLPPLDPNDVAGSLAAASASPSNTPPPSPTPRVSSTPDTTCSISASFANIRTEPSTDSAVVGQLENGVVAAIGRTADNDWYEVQLGEGRGWVAASASNAEGACSTLPITGSSTLEFAECPPNFVGYRTPRLNIGDTGRVPLGNQANRVRAVPQISGTILFQIQPGGEFTVIAGPQCGEGIVWWNIQQGARTGWTAESDVNVVSYFLEPVARDTASDDTLLCDPADADYRPTRLRRTDDTATITDAIPSLILFTEPNLNSATILEIPSGVNLDAINVGPRCNQNAVWWNVTYNTLSGWVVESSTNDPNIEYYLIPPPRPTNATPPPAADTTDITDTTAPAATPAENDAATSFTDNRPRINPFNSRDLTQQAMLSFSPSPYPFMLWGPDGRLLVVNTQQGVQFFVYPALEPRHDLNNALAAAVGGDIATAADIDATGTQLVIGYESGALRLLRLENTPQITTLPFAHRAPVSAIAISRDNTRLLTASGAVYDIPPPDVTFAARVYDYSTLNTTTGDMPVLLEATFPVTEPVLAATFSLTNAPVIAHFDRVLVLGSEGAIFTTQRAEIMKGNFIVPTSNAWAGNGSSVLFGSGPAVAAYDVRTGDVVPRPVVLVGGRVLSMAQAPLSTGTDPVLAVYVDNDEAAGAIDGVVFVTQTDNSGQFQGFIPINRVNGLAFSPTGSTLAILRDASIEFWAVSVEGSAG